MNLGITSRVERQAPRPAPWPEVTALRWCTGCGAEVMMVGPRRAARLDFTDERTILRWAEAGTLHTWRAPGGALLVCLDSLLR